ncbi:MAG TPA: hypothetical protein VG734_19780 [Lacunisphaera sp.]|nr:hypothetical protein [Lacunisphaera sp.]
MTESSPARSAAAGRFAVRLAVFASLLLAVLPLLLLGVAITQRGQLFALASLGIAILPWFFAWAWSLGTAGRRVAFAVPAGIALGWIGLALTSPTGVPSPSARVRHLFPRDGGVYSRYVLGNWLPEADQLRLGFTLMPLIDPLLTNRQAAKLKAATAEIYRELEADPEFAAVGSVLPLAYAELRGSADRGLHAYLYVPPGLDHTRPLPALVFFHGSGGNWKAYLWILSKVADRCGVVLIAPTFGIGAWREPETSERLAATLEAAARHVALDSRRLHVAGLSNGGRAVSELLASARPSFRSYTFISPVFDDRALPRRPGPPGGPGKRVFILTGALDDRVPIGYVRDRASQLEQSGASVKLRVEPAADHFLMFSHRTALIEALANDLRESMAP